MLIMWLVMLGSAICITEQVKNKVEIWCFIRNCNSDLKEEDKNILFTFF